MRDRLIELLDRIFKTDYKGDYESGIEDMADRLLAEGVIVPPVKVGTTLYFLYDNSYADKPDFTPRIYETYRWYFDVDTRGISIIPRNVHGYRGSYHYYLGKTVFLTREEAEKALAERSENGKS